MRWKQISRSTMQPGDLSGCFFMTGGVRDALAQRPPYVKITIKVKMFVEQIGRKTHHGREIDSIAEAFTVGGQD